jgi:hypothetical protein
MSRRPTAAELIDILGLAPLPEEGGRFLQSYRSTQVLPREALGGRYPEDKPAATAIYYLITPEPEGFSALHRLPTDEVFHFYLGDPVRILLLHPDGHSEHLTLGQDLPAGQRVQLTVPAGVWQGSALAPGGEYALLGTTMAPGFTASDYEGGERQALIAAYPAEAELITQLTRPSREQHRRS